MEIKLEEENEIKPLIDLVQIPIFYLKFNSKLYNRWQETTKP